jgi:hypothetical protein
VLHKATLFDQFKQHASVPMVFDEIKATCLSKVAGSCPEKLLYRCLCFVAGLVFVAAVVNVGLKAQSPITDVSIEAFEALPWPVMFFCYKRTIDEVSFNIHPTQRFNQPDCVGVPVVYTLDLTGEMPLKAECLPWFEDTSLTKELQHRFNGYSTQFAKGADNLDGNHNDDWRCRTLNEDGKLASTPDMHQSVDLKWTTKIHAHHADAGDITHVFSGILDPKSKTFTEQTKNGLTVFGMGVVNSKSQIAFTVDQIVEKDITEIFTSSAVGQKVKKYGEVAMKEKVQEILKDETIQLKYNPALNTQSRSPITYADGREQESELSFQVSDYVSRKITRRYKTWDEIWAEIGGTWATAVLLVTAFFAKKTVEDPSKKNEDAAPLDEVQVFRMRGVSSKQAAVKTMYAIATDAVGAAKQNQAQTADAVSLSA